MENFLASVTTYQEKFSVESSEALPQEMKDTIASVEVFLPENTERVNSKTNEVFQTKKSLAFYMKAGGVKYFPGDSTIQNLEKGTVVALDDIRFKILKRGDEIIKRVGVE